MGKFVRDLFEHIQEAAWAFFLLFLLLASLAVIFGRSVGYNLTLWVCLIFAVVVAAIFAVIFVGNLLCIGIAVICRRLSNRRK